eukprot:GHVS01009210.1.p1 GENE.GHVS01009210.1~~GHVS01009210.1.p1  ORF type:complete len:227 (-),score=86.13 GHVS01009210.1:500-1111(-)
MVVIEEAEAAAPALQVEETDSDDSEDSEEGTSKRVDGEEKVGGGEEEEGKVGGGGRHNRNEKKARKSLLKLGLKPVTGIVSVTIRKTKTMAFRISNPEVYKSPVSDTYIIFGEAKVDDLAAHTHSEAAQRFTRPVTTVATSPPPAVAEEPEDESGELDLTGIEEKDIELVTAQVSCTRTKAVAALRANNNDIVEAIMQLSSAE